MLEFTSGNMEKQILRNSGENWKLNFPKVECFQSDKPYLGGTFVVRRSDWFLRWRCLLWESRAETFASELHLLVTWHRTGAEFQSGLGLK